MNFLTKPLIMVCLFAILAGCSQHEAYRDIRPEHWTWWGADMDKVEAAFERIQANTSRTHHWDKGQINKPGKWIYEFTRLGEQTEQAAKEAERQNRIQDAIKLYDEASIYYGFAKYPHINPTKAEDDAMRKQWETYLKSFALEGYAVERLETMLFGQPVYGYLHLPKLATPQPYPVVVGANGLDVLGAESAPLIHDLLNRGIAVVITDIPGTGINRRVALNADFEQLWVRLYDVVSQDSRINAYQAGAFGISFAGNAAAKLALVHPDKFKAVANICGPLHAVFEIQAGQLSEVEPMNLDALVDRMHLPDAHPKRIAREVKQFSLVRQGILDENTKTPTAVVSLNTNNDPIAPPSDMELITNASAEGSIIWSGSDDHCPQFRQRDMPKIAAFFDLHL